MSSVAVAPVHHTTPSRNVCLDGIRGIAIALVIITHGFDGLVARTMAEKLLLSFTKSAWVGVDLFFVLSGYLITGILIRSRDKAPASYFRTFYMRRVFRIFPLYYAFFAMFVMATLIQSKSLGQLELQWNLPYLSNLNVALNGWSWRPLRHLWSLSVEEQFYLIWPTIVFIIPRRRMFASLAAIFCLFLAFRQFCVIGGMSALVVYTTLHLDGILLGAALAAMERQRHAGRVIRLSWSVLLSSAAILSYECFFNSGGMGTESWRGVQMFNFTLIAACGASLICISLYSRHTSWINRVLSWRLLLELGKYSYAIYLFHLPIDTALIALHLHPRSVAGTIVYTILLALVSFGCALVSWKILEEPCIMLKERWFSYAGVKSVSS